MAVTLVQDLIGSSSFSSDVSPGNVQHTVTNPASAVNGTYVTVEITLAPPGTTLTATMSTVPAGWTLITSGVKTGSPTSQVFVYGKFMGASEPA